MKELFGILGISLLALTGFWGSRPHTAHNKFLLLPICWARAKTEYLG